MEANDTNFFFLCDSHTKFKSSSLPPVSQQHPIITMASQPLKDRILKVKQLLLDNPEESTSVIVIIFQVNRTTLATARRKGSLIPKPRGSQNKILTVT